MNRFLAATTILGAVVWGACTPNSSPDVADMTPGPGQHIKAKAADGTLLEIRLVAPLDTEL
jgi:hypothetical protein